MPVIGVDCDIMLAHPDVHLGEPLGFLLYRKPGEVFGPPVKIHYESYTDALGEAADVRHLWFRVLLADRLLNPDGSAHGDSAAVMRENLIAIVMAHSNITLYTPAGLIAGLYSSGHVLIHSIYPGVEIVEVQLTSRSVHFAPVDPARYAASVWVDGNTYSAEMNWDNSYWRT